MTTETKTEARERMSDHRFETSVKSSFETWGDLPGWLIREAREARASEALLTAALSALRAEHQRTQEQAAAMRVFISSIGLPPSLHARADEVLRSSAGRGWVSPEEHQRVVAERDRLRHERAEAVISHNHSARLHRDEMDNVASLRSQLDELTRYIDEAKKACGDDRVTGEPIAQVITALRSQLAEALATIEAAEAKSDDDDAAGVEALETEQRLRAALAASEERAREAGALKAVVRTLANAEESAIIREAAADAIGEAPETAWLTEVLVSMRDTDSSEPVRIAAADALYGRDSLSPSPSAGPASEANEGAAFLCGGPLRVEEVKREDPDPKKCPKCGGRIEAGYGLAGGGIGTYWYCVGTDGGECDWEAKRLDEGDDEPIPSVPAPASEEPKR